MTPDKASRRGSNFTRDLHLGSLAGEQDVEEGIERWMIAQRQTPLKAAQAENG